MEGINIHGEPAGGESDFSVINEQLDDGRINHKADAFNLSRRKRRERKASQRAETTCRS